MHDSTSRTATGRLAVPRSSLVVPAVAALGGAAFLVWKPGVARSMLGSPQAIGFTVAAGAVVLGIGWLLPRLGRGAGTTMAAQAIPVLVAFVATVLPAFHHVTVDEAFPAAAAATGPSSTARPATVVGRAALTGIDHHATGDALLVARADGSYVVRLESLDVEPGPDYHVHLVPGGDARRPDGGVHLGRLRGDRGNQNYAVPATTSTQRPVTLLIWCRAFAVPIAAATIR